MNSLVIEAIEKRVSVVSLTLHSASANPHAAEKIILLFAVSDTAPMNFCDWQA